MWKGSLLKTGNLPEQAGHVQVLIIQDGLKLRVDHDVESCLLLCLLEEISKYFFFFKLDVISDSLCTFISHL